MAALMLAVLILAMTGHSSATWCVCKDVGDANMQKALDYACGAGADCNPIHSNGPCFNPNTVKAHCNYAVNSYFQRKGQAPGSCEFAGAATVTASDPSTAGCVYPSSASTGTATPTTPVTTTTPSTTTPTTMNPGTNTPTGTTPYSSTTPGVLGGVGTGLGPSGAGINTDYSEGYRLQGFSFVTTLLFSGLMLLRA
ncbi:hypothetical protein CCACVL1_28842 [Corchorus capsularis]|uniref:X8 domain-containing protein n=1 Tax=Corchorus capsularis TaxID=210143 RepID=A0A1R3G4Z2_COCAP|nr:hypothetical protein CCACVL1_28842 [Corchorus capsularis]